jgi:hypothetical protein
MLRTFAATLLATALIAGPSLAAPPSGNSGANPSAPGMSDAKAANQQTNASRPSKTVKPASRNARGKASSSKVTRHLKSTKTHRHVIKPVKSVKNSKSDRLQTAKLPATTR